MDSSLKRSPRRESAFLEALATGLSVAAAAQRAGIGRRTAFRWKSQYPHFAKRWNEAVEAGTDLIEDEALRRAVEGFERPVFQGGREVGRTREYSDRLLEILLRARRPQKYRERAYVEHAGPEGGPIEVSTAGERIARRLDEMAERFFAGANVRLVQDASIGQSPDPAKDGT